MPMFLHLVICLAFSLTPTSLLRLSPHVWVLMAGPAAWSFHYFHYLVFILPLLFTPHAHATNFLVQTPVQAECLIYSGCNFQLLLMLRPGGSCPVTWSLSFVCYTRTLSPPGWVSTAFELALPLFTGLTFRWSIHVRSWLLPPYPCSFFHHAFHAIPNTPVCPPVFLLSAVSRWFWAIN